MPPADTEIVSARTKDGAVFQGANGVRTAVLRRGMNYESSPGHFDPVDLTFRPDVVPGTYVEDHSAATVRTSPAGVEATDRSTGKGLRWLTPSAPAVSGSVATVVSNGLPWTFAPTAPALSSPPSSPPIGGPGHTCSRTN